jgi:hypothetical protein
MALCIEKGPSSRQVVAGAFGIYTFNSTGSGQAMATHGDGQLNTIIQTFQPGDLGVL